MRRQWHGLGLGCLLVAAVAGRATGQLVSPGKLAAPHADLEGMSKCTECHELRQRGIMNERCLKCHVVLATRVAANRGLHASFGKQNCAVCHKEHFGTDFTLTRHDPANFDHAKTGFALRGAHLEPACRDCHRPERIVDAEVQQWGTRHGVLDHTYLGLGTACANCHQKDDPHKGRLGKGACDECHGEEAWKPAPGFDHGHTRYPLDGRHRNVSCTKCHTGTTYTGVAFSSCGDCHRDPHRGSMQGGCATCHSTAGWGLVNAAVVESSFDHSRTRFALVGAHSTLPCASCHDPNTRHGATVRLRFVAAAGRRTYPAPASERCGSCHLDVHAGQFRSASGETQCGTCHDATAWRPTTYTAARHDKWPLQGAHAGLTCERCHDPASTHGPTVRMAFSPGAEQSYPMPVAERCSSCHVDVHAGQFVATAGGPGCDNCHEAAEWVPTTYGLERHQGWRLTGAHQAVPCGDCHTPGLDSLKLPVFRLEVATCAGCHARIDPHGGQFAGRSCDDCHTTDTFKLPGFDHSRTRYPLDGAHRTVPCASCHRPVPDASGRLVAPYRGLGMACRDCHGAPS